MRCAELVEQATDFLDGAVDSEQVGAHLEICEGCRRYLEQMRETIRMLGWRKPVNDG